ncbi:hypothetical protein [Methylobacterium iners]|nr:hypothetical protein [Methylobacterium iners]
MARASTTPPTADEQDDARDAAVMKAVLTLLDTLPEARRRSVLQRLSANSKPISGRKSGEVMGIVIDFIRDKRSWSVSEIKEEVLQHHSETNPKEIYNTINYLAKTGRIKRIGYGKYMVDGNLVISADQFSEEPFPNDDQADN